jgi:hypothetical protein
MRLLGARRDEPASATVDPYLQAFDSWFAELSIGDGPIGRHELIDHLLDLRLRLTTIQQLEDSLAEPAAGSIDAGAIPIELPTDEGDGLRKERSRHGA